MEDKKILTKEGLKELEEELEYLRVVKRKELSRIIKEARETAYKAVDIALLKRNWLLGKRIVEEELQDTRSENYGQEIIKKLSKRLGLEFGKGFEPLFATKYKLCLPSEE